MKKFIFVLSILNTLIGKSQVNGVTVYTSNISCYQNNANRQQISQAPNGDIYVFDTNYSLCKFSSGVFTSTLSPLWNPIQNVFATSNGVWIYSNYGDFTFYNGITFTDFSSNITALIGTVSPTNPINYAGTQGSNILFATNQGIIKYNGVIFSIINKANSNLVCDTVNCILNNGTNVYIGTDKGLFTFNGVTFSSIIPFVGSPNQKVNYIFSNGAKTIVTRNDNTSIFNFYTLSGNQLNRLHAYPDSVYYTSDVPRTMAFISNNPIFTDANNFMGNWPRMYLSANTYTNYVVPSYQSNIAYPLPDPSNPQKFYIAYMSPFTIAEINPPVYGNYFPVYSPEGYKYLDTNNVNASIGTTSIKHSLAYEVPKGSGINADFVSTLWIGGLDNGGQLHLAGETYRQNGQDFWPGPLDTTNAIANNITGTPFNKVWKISCNQINQFAANANAANYVANTSTVFNDINTYIANGNNTNNFAKQLAPFYDVNNNGIYEPNIGEYPIIKGHQQIYSVYNDNYTTHTETNGLPLGVEVHERSYAFNWPNLADTMQVINNATFYNYQIINRSNNNYNNVYMTLWDDPDLGYYLNDYIGTDTLNQFGYVYNGTTSDPNYGGINGYGNKLPMLAFALIPKSSNQTDGIDNNNNGQIDEPNERFKMNLTTYYNNNIGPFPPATTNPATKWQYYNYMSGRWKDSSYFKPAGSAYNPTLAMPPTNYVYTGNPQTFAGWTEATASITPGDRRILCTIGPFNFLSKKKVEFEYAYVFSRDTTLNNVNNNLSLLRRDVKNVKYFLNQQNPPACAPTVTLGINEKSLNKSGVWIYPNPTSSELIINLDYNAKNAKINLYDITGRIILETTLQNSYAKRLDLSQLSNGVYFVEIADENNKVTKKIIKN